MRRGMWTAAAVTVSKAGLAIGLAVGASTAAAQVANEDQSAANPGPAQDEAEADAGEANKPGPGNSPVDEVVSVMDDLRAHGVEMLTLGQYLRPSARHLPVEEFVEPSVFTSLAREAYRRSSSPRRSGRRSAAGSRHRSRSA